MKNSFKKLTSLIIVVNVFVVVLTSSVLAEDDNTVTEDKRIIPEEHYKIAVGIGILTVIGLDVRLQTRESHSPWVFGLRYLNIKDNFVNEALVGLPNDTSDKRYTRRFGPEVDYLFKPNNHHSLFIGGGLFTTSKKLECDIESDSATKTGPFLGGGLQGQWSKSFGYQLGILLSPISTSLKTANCASDEGGESDVNASLFLAF